MKKFAQILNNKVHWVFENEDKPNFHESFECIEITTHSPMPEEGWNYENNEFTPNLDSEEHVRNVIKQKVRICLSASDWIHMPDASLTIEEKNDWLEYRKKVKEMAKNIPKNTQFKDIIFPTLPKSP